MSFTPGPWSVHHEDSGEITINAECGQVATVFQENCDFEEQVEGDATLIAAAPEMLEALRILNVWLIAPRTDTEAIAHALKVVNAAIDKAYGIAEPTPATTEQLEVSQSINAWLTTQRVSEEAIAKATALNDMAAALADLRARVERLEEYMDRASETAETTPNTEGE